MLIYVRIHINLYICAALRTVGLDLCVCACWQNRGEGHHLSTVSHSTGAWVN